MVDLCWLVLEAVGPNCGQATQRTAINGAIAPTKVTQPTDKVTASPTPAVPAIAAITVDATPTLAPTCAAVQKKPELCEAGTQARPVARINNAPVVETRFTPAIFTPATPLPVPPQTIPQVFTDPSSTTAPSPAQGATSSQGPSSGGQLYRQRQLALQSGHLYTRLPVESFANQWRTATRQPTYQDWLQLLTHGAAQVRRPQGQNRLEVVVGDSLGMWLPPDTLPRDRLWLNQSISGDTTAGVLRRLDTFAATRPTVIHLMIGVNDLKNNVPEAEIVANLRAIITRLQRQYPQAQLVVYSVLPTRRDDISNGRVRSLNNHIAYLASHHQIGHRDMLGLFGDQGGALRAELTTDGLHLNRQGYSLWQQVIVAAANRV
ncbi:MAG: GDSL-type esterase/lipase family protein [Cyanobacteria bacterium]|nr:GDSL-type esterase/lipase family protein [Cyanobacteriota bacterium]